MLDNGAFSFWTLGKKVDWHEFYAWAEEWLEYQTTWAVIPDVIDGDRRENDQLVVRCPIPRHQAAPVWHLHEPIDRIFYFLDLGYTRICFGSSGEYAQVGSDRWHHRVTQAFNRLGAYGTIPWVHMLRGMALSGSHYPFASVDSTDIARHHHEPGKNAKQMAERWDAIQCPAGWNQQLEQQELL